MQASPGCNLEVRCGCAWRAASGHVQRTTRTHAGASVRPQELERHQEHIWRFENEAIQDVIKRSRLPPRRSASVPASRGLGSREKSTPWPGLTHGEGAGEAVCEGARPLHGSLT